MAKSKAAVQEEVETTDSGQIGVDVLAKAIAQATTAAIQAAKPIEKKTILTYTGKNPWSPPDGEAKLKLKRTMYIHSLMINPDQVSNAEIKLLNKVRPGRYCDGFISVERRRDKGINITWPIKTVDQRMRMSAIYGIRNLEELLQRCIDEDRAPKPERPPEWDDD